jgi:hypothetical protein
MLRRSVTEESPRCSDRLIALVYFLALFPAFVVGTSHTPSVGFQWGQFWQFELVVPTILAAIILVLAWVVNPTPGQRTY